MATTEVKNTSFIGPTGERMTVDDLPPTNTKRWVIRRKAEVVLAVTNGLISLEDACDRYQITEDEFFSWKRALDYKGLNGLKVTKASNFKIS
mgnify:CR=1 FL=1